MPDRSKKEKRVKIKVEEEAATDVSQTPVQETPPEKEDENKHQQEFSKESVVEEKSETKPSETTTPTSESKTSFWILFVAFLAGLLIGAGLIGGIFYYSTKVEKTDQVDPTPTPLSSTEPATDSNGQDSTGEKKAPDYFSLKIQILNGSGKAGEAGKAEKMLTDAGFTETDTGNASRFDFTATMVSLKDDVTSDGYDAILEALSSYEVEKGDALADSSEYDVVITIGKTTK